MVRKGIFKLAHFTFPYQNKTEYEVPSEFAVRKAKLRYNDDFTKVYVLDGNNNALGIHIPKFSINPILSKI